MTVVADRYVLGASLGRLWGIEIRAATDLTLQRPVAVTIVPSPHDRGRTTVARAHAAAVRSHPNLVTVLDAGESERGVFVVTQRLGADTLADRLTGRPWSQSQVVALLDGMLAAVEGLHADGRVVGGFGAWQVRPGVDGIWALAALPAWDGDATPLPLAGEVPADTHHADWPLRVGADVAAAGLLGAAALAGPAAAQGWSRAHAALTSAAPGPLREVILEALAAHDTDDPTIAAQLRRTLPGGAPEGLPATVALPAPAGPVASPARGAPRQRLRRMARALTAGARR